MDLGKALHRIPWKAMWNVLKVYKIGRKLLSDVKLLYKNANTCVKVMYKWEKSSR